MSNITTGQMFAEWQGMNEKLNESNAKQQLVVDKLGQTINTHDDAVGEKVDALKEVIENEQSLTRQVEVTNFPANQNVTDADVKAELQSIKQQQENTNAKLDDFITNQRQIINVLNSDKLIFGAYWDKGSNSTMTRTDAAVGMVAEAGVDGQLVRNDFDSAPIWGEIEEVMDAYGNYFIRIPKFYIRKIIGKDFRLVQVSKTRYPGFYLPWVFWDFGNSKEPDYYDHAKYKASLSDDGKLESKPDKYPLVFTNIVQMRNYARANNAEGAQGYQQLDVHAHDVLAVLFQIEFATIHSQSIMQGWTAGRYTSAEVATLSEENTNRIIVANSSASYYSVGQPISVGTSQGGNQVFYGREITAIDAVGDYTAIYFDGDPVNIIEGNNLYNTGWKNGFSRDILASSGSIGDNTSGKYPCMYRGIESPWGDVYQFVDGMNISDNQTWVAKDAEEYASNVFAAPYEKIGYVNSDVNGYAREMGFDKTYPYAEFPITVGGSSSTYYADNYYQSTGARIARVGGRWVSGSVAGLFVWDLASSSSYSGVYVGGRLLKKAL